MVDVIRDSTASANDFLGRWLQEVTCSGSITDSCRVLLLVAVRHMDATGRFEVMRSDLALKLGRSTRRVDERLEQAIRAGYLVRVTRGQKYVTAVHRAALPNSQHDGSQRAETGSARRITARRDDPKTLLSATPGGRSSTYAVACEVFDVERAIKKEFEVVEVGPTPAVSQR